MTENKRFKAHIFDDGVNERYHDGIIDNENDENVIRNYQYISNLLNKLHNEKEQLKRINKGQELEIVRLHKLADAMSGVLRELGVYDVYDKQQIENRKKENEEINEERDYFERKKCDYQKKISILTTDKIQLKQENEQLRFDFKEMKELCYSFEDKITKLTEILRKHHNHANEECQKNLNNPIVHRAYDIIRYDILCIAKEMGVDLDE